MYRAIILLSVLTCTVTRSIGQDAIPPISCDISIVDDTGAQVESGYVMVFDAVDSSLLVGDVFEDGTYTFDLTSDKVYRLQISALGYEPFSFLGSAGAISELKEVQLITTELTEIEVRANTSNLTQENGKVKVQVANTSLGNLGSALEVLRNTPLIEINNANQITVVGKGSALLYVDGQLTTGTQLLSTLSAADLQDVEIIMNPSSKYDAAGNAVISISTKKKSLDGYRIDLLSEVGKGRFYRGYFKTDAYTKLGKALLQASYGFRPWKFKARNDYGRSYDDNGLIRINNSYRFERTIAAQDYSLKGSYELSKESEFGFHFLGNLSNADNEVMNKNVFYASAAQDFRIDTKLAGPLRQQNNSITAYFEHQLDTLGSQIKMSGQHAKYDFTRQEGINQLVTRGPTSSLTNLRTDNASSIKISSAQFDYLYAKDAKAQWEIGAKITGIQNKSSLIFESMAAPDAYVQVDDLSTLYNYQESIYALYGSVSTKLSSFDLRAGLRAELTQTKGVAGGSQNIEGEFGSEYGNLFPSLGIDYAFDSGLSLSASYNYRIQRPSFQELNPFTIYVDSLVSFIGNPLLVPEYSTNYSLSASKGRMTISVDHNYVRDPINTVIIVESESPARFNFKRDNILSTQMTSMTLGLSLSKGTYSSFWSLVGRVENHRYQDQDRIVSNRQNGYYLYTNQSIQVPGDVTLGFTFQYTSPRVDGLYTDDPISALGFSISRRFFENKLTARLIGNDILDDYKFTGTASIANNAWTYLSRGDWQYLQLSLQWNFGKFTSDETRDDRISQDEIQRIRQQ